MAPVTTQMKAGRTGMLHKLFLWVTGHNAETKKTAQAPEARGYLRPQTVDVLLGTEIRQKMLKQIRENSLLTKEATEKYYMQPLRHCVSLMQGLPGTEREHHAVVGGLVDLTLKTVVCALRLSRGYMLPQGASAEEQSAQAVTWNAVIFYAALCHSLPVFGHLEGELADGSLWYPGLTVPSQPYRLRFCPDRDEKAQAIATLLGMRLLPDEVVVWLGRTPAALDTLLNQIQGDNRPGSVVSQIISEAVGYAGGVPRTQSLQPVPQTPATPVVSAAGVAPVANPVIAGAADTAVTLGSALSEPPAAVVTATPPVSPGGGEPDDQGEPAVSDVMALMGFSTSERQEAEAASILQPEDLAVVKTGKSADHLVDKTEAQKNYGEQFWEWLSDGIRTGGISVNNPDSLVHITGGMVFIPTPEIFFTFLKNSSCISPDVSRDDIQREFEKLGRNFCRKDNSLFQCLKYEEEDRQGRHKRWSGYLIMARKIYTNGDVPGDSMYLFVSRV
ncbi:TPA: TraI domain-containing protein [Salmonella enterica subsp. diarizonae serovar 16:z10:e,n,x,z15]|nr:TraI domain-containing protein [Salmonella enterica subsp. diarizonae serovar 16:z10:e,n,x,z15]